MSPIERRLSLDGGKFTLLRTFCFEVAALQVCFTITCYTLLHQAAMGKGKNRLRKGSDIFVSDRDPQQFFIIILPSF